MLSDTDLFYLMEIRVCSKKVSGTLYHSTLPIDKALAHFDVYPYIGFFTNDIIHEFSEDQIFRWSRDLVVILAEYLHVATPIFTEQEYLMVSEQCDLYGFGTQRYNGYTTIYKL